MLRIFDVLLQLLRRLRGPLAALDRRDPDLARQCRRALESAALNIAEGSGSRGRNRPARYQDALGSMREALACFEVAEALGYLPPLEVELHASFLHIIRTLLRLVLPR